MTDSIVNSGSGTAGDYSATHSVSNISSDLNFGIRNGSDTAGFTYRIIGQASADSTIFSVSDTASVAGKADFGFTLPAGLSDAALWDISVTVLYNGVAASDDFTSSAKAGPLTLSSAGIASGISSTLAGTGTVSNGPWYPPNAFDIRNKSGALPGTGTVSLNVDLAASSSNPYGTEAIAAIGQKSTLGAFSLDDSVVDTTNGGAFITVTLKPHLNFSGQTLPSGLSLANSENLSGFGTVTGNIQGVPGSHITPSGSGLILGDASYSSVFHFGGTLNVGESSVTLREANYAEISGTANLGGGTINAANGLQLTGISRISGAGTVNGPFLGSAYTTINPSGSGLTLGSLSSPSGFNFGGTINVASSSVTLRDSNYAEFSGAANLSGGSIHAANGLQLASAASMTGYGTITAGGGGLDNFGTMALRGGPSTINGTVTNQTGGGINVDGPATFTGNVTNAGGGTIKVTNSNVIFSGTLTNNGAYISDPATTYAADIVVGSTGYLVGGAGDRWILTGDLVNRSAQKTLWSTGAAYLGFVAGTDALASLYIPGADLGASQAGYLNNFAWGTLEIGSGKSLYLFDGNSDSGGALYVGQILGVNLSGLDVANITGNGLNIYYDRALNTALGGLTYALAGGGVLTPGSPVPIPGSLILLGSGLLGLVGVARKRRKK